MKENEFDIMARNLLQNAEEPVSPRVWNRISAALDGQQPRVVPFWAWSLAAVAAAAAVVLGVFLWRPGSVQPSPAEEVLLAQVTEATEVAEETEVEAISVPAMEEQLARSVAAGRTAAVETAMTSSQIMQTEAPQTEAAETAVSETAVSEVPEEPVPAETVSKKQETPVSQEDIERLNQLLREDAKPAPARRRFSLQLSGNVQDNQRGGVTTSAWMRASRPPVLIGNQDEGIYNEYPEISFNLPLSVGIGLKYYVADRWAVGTGIRYTNLSRTFVGDYVDADGFPTRETDIDNQQHWLGVPLNLYFDIITRGNWRVTSFLGGSAEYLMDNYMRIHSSPSDISYHQGSAPIQWSCNVGVGVEFRVSPHIGIFLDPSFRYYIGTEHQPRSIRTIQPLRFDVETGLRFFL